METLRISATDLDAIRYWWASEYASLNDLLAQLRRESEPTEAMLRGTAFHEVLEAAGPGMFEAVATGGYNFDLSGLDNEIALPTIREIKATREYEIDKCGITLVGKADAIHGKTGYDHKLTSRFDPERYLSSYQWRVYMEVFGLDHFVWNAFEGSERDGVVKINAVHHLPVSRYPELESDLLSELGQAVSFYRQHLPDRFTGYDQ